MEEILKNEVKSFRICIHINDLLNAIFLSVQDLSGSVSLHREKKHWPVRLQTDTSYRMTETSFCLHFMQLEQCTKVSFLVFFLLLLFFE